MVTAGSFERLRDKGMCLVEVRRLRCWLWWARDVELQFQNPLHGYLETHSDGTCQHSSLLRLKQFSLAAGESSVFKGRRGWLNWQLEKMP